MTQPLNYTPKAIAELLSYPCVGAPATAAGNRYLADKLRDAQIFVLQDGGQLLDRSKPRPEVPAVIFKPSFPVVALEYVAADIDWGDSIYTQTRSTKRIALAWEYQGDLPPVLASYVPRNLQPGVMIASICWFDKARMWIAMPVAAHLAYSAMWSSTPNTHLRQEMIRTGRLSRAHQEALQPETTPILLSPETFTALAGQKGGFDTALSAAGADVMDEANAYLDLCYALACKNVSTREHRAPTFLNRQRLKANKLPLKGFHVLELANGADLPGAANGGDRAAARSHLRRGHIRRLNRERVTWVNSTVVRGRGFVDKVYAA